MNKNILLFVRMMYTFGFFYYGYQTIFSEYHLRSFGCMVLFYGMGMVITYQLNRLTPRMTEREKTEREILLEKLTTEITSALDKQIVSVYIVIEKKTHPTAGVYYNVVTREN